MPEAQGKPLAGLPSRPATPQTTPPEAKPVPRGCDDGADSGAA